MAAERERIAADLHDTVGQILVSIGLLARRYAEELPSDSPWTERVLKLAALADRGKWEIDQAIRALTFVPEVRRGLVVSLRQFLRSFEADSGISVVFDVQTAPDWMESRTERALYRVAHQALVNAWRHARCASIRVELQAENRDLVLRIRDDGVGIGKRHARNENWVGIASMKRTVEEAGGLLRVTRQAPRGVMVEARVPVPAR